MRGLRSPFFLCVGLALLCHAGCGPSTSEISGKVTIGTKAVVCGTVNLMGEGDLTYQGQIEPDGKFVIKGVPHGEYRVMVFSQDPSPPSAVKRKEKIAPGADIRTKEREEFRSKWTPLPKKYNSYEESGLTVRVNQAHHVFDIPLQEEIPLKEETPLKE